ncbi:ClpXP protease specificity-enhancing factor SspB [Bartonella sp. HY329]|uniref:SspB family protein n=1 Tax=unclassified Bartonella TaxID=2645622 RepID=UPI0021CA9469|nr:MULTISPECIES: ClpXP protease specificity-enhancing factor SspB [unclassified Bartonella]UXM94531.1 ClpXP protease specificity-enhancing factor SspB [Bartonella sp. HY329]UXN08855.1 ClpXP protease specificity-enhancing factor SspB [Bartonella sp. HY328]
MATDRIHYEVLVQDALRNVIRNVLTEVAKSGLPGEHHFFITFLTNLPGVEISKRLKERYPEQMTIVLQNQFWDLKVDDKEFSVTLSFGDVPEYLKIPFVAVQGFYDPAAAFEASFDLPEMVISSLDDDEEEILIEKDDGEAVPVITIMAQEKPTDEGTKKVQKSESRDAGDGKEKASADVVSLDAFRKK